MQYTYKMGKCSTYRQAFRQATHLCWGPPSFVQCVIDDIDAFKADDMDFLKQKFGLVSFLLSILPLKELHSTSTMVQATLWFVEYVIYHALMICMQ